MNGAFDFLVVGGGPAGLTASIYLGRFRRRVLVVDKGWSRAEWITLSHNLPGYPEGVAGPVLLDRLREQARLYGAALVSGTILTVRIAFGGFCADMEDACFTSPSIIMCTGILENKPPVPHFADAVKRGLIRTCPICDGYECIDKRLSVLGDGEHAAAEALFLRTYTSKLSLLVAADAPPLSRSTQDALRDAGIEMIRFAAGAVHIDAANVTVLSTAEGATHRFDAIYSAFGTVPQTQLGEELGAKIDESGRLWVDAHQETSVRNFFAAGDLVRGLNQISVADGEAAIATTAVHNRLSKAQAA